MIIIVFGKRGSGKTTLVRRLIKRLENAIVLDPLGDDYIELPVCISSADYTRYHKCRVIPFTQEIEQSFFRSLQWLNDRTIVIEEIDKYCSPYFINSYLNDVVKYGRHRNLSLIGVSRRPSEISRHLTANANTIFSFKMIEPRDLQYFKLLNGEFATCIQRLGQYEFAKIQL